jgi:hypothetical protein
MDLEHNNEHENKWTLNGKPVHWTVGWLIAAGFMALAASIAFVALLPSALILLVLAIPAGLYRIFSGRWPSWFFVKTTHEEHEE